MKVTQSSVERDKSPLTLSCNMPGQAIRPFSNPFVVLFACYSFPPVLTTQRSFVSCLERKSTSQRDRVQMNSFTADVGFSSLSTTQSGNAFQPPTSFLLPFAFLTIAKHN